MTVRLKIILAFCLSVVILIITGIYAYKSTSEYKNASEWVSHTQRVISEVENILLNIQEIESAQRGYVITGSEKYLKPYKKALSDLDSTYLRVKTLVSDNPQQQLLLDSIDTQIELKVAFAKRAIGMRQQGGFEAAQRMVATDVGQTLMERIHLLVDNFITDERKLLSERLIRVKENFAGTVGVIITSISLAILIVLITMYFFIVDYNKRLKSEKQLLESESRTLKFLDSLPLGVVIFRPGRIPYYENIQFKKLFARDKYPGAEFPGYIGGTNTPYPPERLPTVRALNGEKNIFIEDLEIEMDGRRIPLRINATSVQNLEGEIEYAISVIEDITDVKQTEKILIEAKKIAEQSSEIKEAFLANMSHEIRTPMNAIIGFTDLLLKKDLPYQEKEYVQTIKNSGENLMRIINDILDVSKIDSGMMTFEEHPINIRELFNSVQTMLSEKARMKKLILSFEVDPSIPETVAGDPTRLTQVIINLVGNAIKFTKQGSVSVFVKKLKEDDKGYQFEFAVKDTGIGIPEDKLQTIFERFRQAESHTTRNYGGTGLGLSIAKQLIELQGGQITIRSMVDVGSVFSFTLPFKKTNELQAPKHKSAEDLDVSELSRISILLAEDNPVNVKFILSLFGEYNIHPDIAENGKQAVDKLKAKEYDLVLMDMEMPEMNGYEATIVIRNELKKATPIIAMTAHAMAGEKEKCLQLGMNDYISKPIKTELLFEKMLAVTDSQRKSVTIVNAPDKLINLEFLVRSMRGKTSVIRETIEIFITQMSEDLIGLEAAMAAGDQKTIKSLAHRMRSTVSFMGIEQLETVLEELEAKAGTGVAPEGLTQLHAAIIQLSKQSLREIEIEKLLYV